ncbi:hypothetical protein SAMN04487930_101348 [Cytophaga hutchinsonii ATCC 33406]|nr:hypothetical protein SAMN04487930_101348 [Cytophaga hutchinsonii ATCC 33406]
MYYGFLSKLPVTGYKLSDPVKTFLINQERPRFITVGFSQRLKEACQFAYNGIKNMYHGFLSKLPVTGYKLSDPVKTFLINLREASLHYRWL